MAELLCIVARDEPGLYEWLRAEFSAPGLVDVIRDRRTGERRRERLPVAAERRSCDRRQQDITHELQAAGWAFVPAAAPN